ncbi:cell division protein FtsQ [Paracoccus suum]|uniref:Cell division protein FtsQ n=1 Tax=Paracoccus suum TaxID=2259340 RepID=A0A344PH74_9RHOB|nr:cell division protein FtsQ/DivIB [Paracoccus suum]AXC48729.1 cell division protein FtsQ [Paracoccus suum]
MQGLRPSFFGDEGAARPAPIRPAGARPDPLKRAVRRDPAPSRLAYRLNRLWLTPIYRKIVRVGLPAFMIAMVCGLWLSDPDRRAGLTGSIDGLVDRIQHRDEFMVSAMRIDGASEAVDRALRAMLPGPLPASSFDIDLEALRAKVLKLDAVKTVELRIQPDGVLSAVVTERAPAMLWRHARGLEVLDDTGHRVASVTGRDVRGDLPLIAGEGADKAAPEAMALIDAAGPILPRVRGLERVGERRWDVTLDRGQRIMLPADAPLVAFERAIAMQRDAAVLDRDVSVVDLRDTGRPVLRLGLDAQNAIRRARAQPELGPDGQPIEPKAEAVASKGKTGGAKTAKTKPASSKTKTAPKAAAKTSKPGAKPAA